MHSFIFSLLFNSVTYKYIKLNENYDAVCIKTNQTVDYIKSKCFNYFNLFEYTYTGCAV